MADGTTTPERRFVLNRRPHSGQYFTEPLGQGIGIDMMLIRGGTFLMGSPAGEIGSNDSEQPQHKVTVPTFFMSRTPITQAQWKRVADPIPDRKGRNYLEPDPSRYKGDNRPVEQVSWDDATEFCQLLSQQTGRTYCLPSEAEWEYACRAGTTTPFHFGETISDELANYDARKTYGRGVVGEYRGETTEVGNFPPNRFGLFDMHGNVWEWCQDHFNSSYEGAPEDGSAWLETNDEGTAKVLRGGSWDDVPGNCRSASRVIGSRGIDDGVGFRVCYVPPRILLSS
ncbi:MAG: formylglycine-generating enzyme family protein [Synechococcus sp.]